VGAHRPLSSQTALGGIEDALGIDELLESTSETLVRRTKQNFSVVLRPRR
jgi:hypothetical protein